MVHIKNKKTSADDNQYFNPSSKSAPKYKLLDDEGVLGVIAAMILMTLLYSARAARFELFHAIQYLAKRITRWDRNCDKRLHRLMCYIYSTVDDKMFGYIGDSPECLTLHLYADASFASCPYTLHSTSGEHHSIQGPNSRFAWAAAAAGQTCLAQSTPEAEIVSLNTAMRSRGEAGLTISRRILAHYRPTDKRHRDISDQEVHFG